MDPGPEGKLYSDDYNLSIDSFSELESEEWLHGLQLADDGKEEGISNICALEYAVVENAKLINKTVNSGALQIYLDSRLGSVLT